MNKLPSRFLGKSLAAVILALGSTLPAFAEDPVIYTAELQPMNATAAGSETTGQAKFTINGDELTIEINVAGSPPDTIHWQHFHGFPDAGEAACAGPDADTNGDGIVDLIETEPASGTTMVPFTNDPASMDIPAGVYPKSDSDGKYEYKETVSFEALSKAFASAFEGQELDLDKRVVLIHGVPEGTKLPDSVQSLGPIPATTTLPIACGKIVLDDGAAKSE